jgi:ATP-dependent DNA ligase
VISTSIPGVRWRARSFPRILRWRIDKPVEEADTLDNLNALLAP